MATLSLPRFLSLSRICRYNSSYSCCSCANLLHIQDFGLQSKWGLRTTPRKRVTHCLAQEEPTENGAVVGKKKIRTPRKTASRTKKKPTTEAPMENSSLENSSNGDSVSASSGDSKRNSGRSRKKVAQNSAEDEVKIEKQVRRQRRTVKKVDVNEDKVEDKPSEDDFSDYDESLFSENVENESEDDLEWVKNAEEDISFTYDWPPLVCCFGAAQHAFVPSGRPANRLINQEIHDRMKDVFWAPEKFFRAPGTSAGSVAIALAHLGGKVAFMGKLGDDDYGQAMLYYLNVNNVQTRSVCLDKKRSTSSTRMKVGKRSRLKMSCLRTCAEDSLSVSEINIDVLREAKMFYFSTHSLLDRSMRSTTMQALKISKKLEGVVFYDVNLPMPLWQSREEAKMFIWKAWNLADIIEVTKQELEFLCGIRPSEEFDTENNSSSKFVHYEPEVIAPLWHENLKILFVTNGTSKIHYYTKEFDGALCGTEDPALSPFTSEMSASGDGIVAGLMRMLTVQPHLATDKGYLKRTVQYAIDCGVVDQWLLGKERGLPPKDDMEDEVEPDPFGIRSVTETEYRTLSPVAVS